MEKKLENYRTKHKNLLDKIDNNLILIKEVLVKIKQILKMR